MTNKYITIIKDESGNVVETGASTDIMLATVSGVDTFPTQLSDDVMFDMACELLDTIKMESPLTFKRIIDEYDIKLTPPDEVERESTTTDESKVEVGVRHNGVRKFLTYDGVLIFGYNHANDKTQKFTNVVTKGDVTPRHLSNLIRNGLITLHKDYRKVVDEALFEFAMYSLTD